MPYNKPHKIGFWQTDRNGLPCFNYTGAIPYKARLENGEDVRLPEDPWFLLGNYHITLFTHISGEYELISGQRSWGRLNQGKTLTFPSGPWAKLDKDKNMNGGSNSASVTINGNEIRLTGLASIAADSSKNKRSFGCGWAEYEYCCYDTDIKRTLSVKPSLAPNDGTSAFLLTVTIKNNGDTEKSYIYKEQLGVNYREIQFQYMPEEYLKAKCVYEPLAYENIGAVKITTQTNEPMKPAREEMSRYEFYPPSPFMCDLSGLGKISATEKSIEAEFSFNLAPQEEKQFQLVIGFTMNGETDEIKSVVNKLNCGKADFGDEWLKIIPDFENEKDEALRRELRWHAYNLEAMATYCEYYGETKVPQGTIYDYHWGQHASARDNFQHALPLVYYNPKLAKSVLRYMLKRTTPFGEIRLIEMGNGYADNDRYFTSDQQLYFFLLLSEYLRVTKDYSFISEKVMPYPAKNQTEMTVAELTEKCFIFLRDTIGTGVHGLVKLLNSDWNDAVYYIEEVPYNNIFFTGESHMNSAMAISIFQTLIPELKNAGLSDRLCGSMEFYRSNIFRAFMEDMGERSFPRRMYFNGKPYGDDNMFLEPQGFTLQFNELSVERKRALYDEMQKRVYSGEKLGAREQEAPELNGENGFEKGSRENGGFWWALNGPVIIGVSQFDKSEADRLLKNMTLQHFSEEFPQYWSSYWSTADNIESSLIPEEGLPDQTIDYAAIPVYCAHPHAWILYCYYRINE